MSNEFEESYTEPAPAETPERPNRRPSSSRSRRPPAQRSLPSSLPWWIAGAAVLVAAGVGIYFGAIRSSSPTKTAKGPTAGGGYRLTYPKNWHTVPPNSVAPGQKAFAAVRQKKGTGLVVLRLGAKVTKVNDAYVHGLENQLKKGAGAGYKLIGAHVIKLSAGQALDVTYDLTKQHEVRNVVVLPFAKGSIVMATVAKIGDQATTREIDNIVGSFQLTG